MKTLFKPTLIALTCFSVFGHAAELAVSAQSSSNTQVSISQQPTETNPAFVAANTDSELRAQAEASSGSAPINSTTEAENSGETSAQSNVTAQNESDDDGSAPAMPETSLASSANGTVATTTNLVADLGTTGTAMLPDSSVIANSALENAAELSAVASAVINTNTELASRVSGNTAAMLTSVAADANSQVGAALTSNTVGAVQQQVMASTSQMLQQNVTADVSQNVAQAVSAEVTNTVRNTINLSTGL